MENGPTRQWARAMLESFQTVYGSAEKSGAKHSMTITGPHPAKSGSYGHFWHATDPHGQYWHAVDSNDIVWALTTTKTKQGLSPLGRDKLLAKAWARYLAELEAVAKIALKKYNTAWSKWVKTNRSAPEVRQKAKEAQRTARGQWLAAALVVLDAKESYEGQG